QGPRTTSRRTDIEWTNLPTPGRTAEHLCNGYRKAAAEGGLGPPVAIPSRLGRPIARVGRSGEDRPLSAPSDHRGCHLELFDSPAWVSLAHSEYTARSSASLKSERYSGRIPLRSARHCAMSMRILRRSATVAFASF